MPHAAFGRPVVDGCGLGLERLSGTRVVIGRALRQACLGHQRSRWWSRHWEGRASRREGRN
eukprot:744234-Prymnesium_polylepis.1